MYFNVLRGLGKDDEDTVAYVLSTLKDKILVEESLILPSLRSVLFGNVTLEQLASISAREDDRIASELAHDVLVKVCTDPSNGLMPDAKRKLGGNSDRLLMLMKKLRAVEIGYHKDLLLAIVRGRPSLASAFFDEFPYNMEDFASPSWFSSISLAAELVSSVRTSCSFDFLSADQRATSPGGSDVQTIMKCLCPRPFSRSLITKGMLHSDFLVRHVTLRFMLETLRLLDSFVASWNLCSSHRCSVEQIQVSLEQNVMGEVRSFYPEFQVLWTLLKPLDGSSKTEKPSSKRKTKLDRGLSRQKRFKQSEKDVSDEEAGDIVVVGIGSDKDSLADDNVDAHMTNQEDAEREYLGIVSEIWASELCFKPIDSVGEAEKWFHLKLLDALKIYVCAVHNVLEGAFDVFMKFVSNSLNLPAELQRACCLC
ncbi:PREDICTED: uncharacterized protein LOC104722228 isoform X2 [Camelina sativa]|uniref:Uncharacterized protein LOC104722228 isoform X2 n=1 Tax=Camelina sativa TaxID=90675 RepID=A0ABM0UBD4_CAMSA|nr:PREDICTED: uncharacterized protein LOC104722228 isoform X2 [Camelina sativa]